jgi:hypothetical protein
MKPVRIAIRFHQEGGPATIQVVASAQRDLPSEMGAALGPIQVRPEVYYSDHSPDRSVACATVTEPDGSRLTQRRAAQVLRVLGQSFAVLADNDHRATRAA